MLAPVNPTQPDFDKVLISLMVTERNVRLDGGRNRAVQHTAHGSK